MFEKPFCPRLHGGTPIHQNGAWSPKDACILDDSQTLHGTMVTNPLVPQCNNSGWHEWAATRKKENWLAGNPDASDNSGGCLIIEHRTFCNGVKMTNTWVQCMGGSER